MNFGKCSIGSAELWGLYQGLTMAWQGGVRWLRVEVDSLCCRVKIMSTRLWFNRLRSSWEGIGTLLLITSTKRQIQRQTSWLILLFLSIWECTFLTILLRALLNFLSRYVWGCLSPPCFVLALCFKEHHC